MKNWLDKYDDGGTIPSFPVSANASLTHVDNPCGPGYVLTTDAQGNDICVNPASIQREGSDYGQQLREASQGTPTYVGSSWDVNRDGPYPSLKPSMPLETYSEVICPECSKQEKRNITKSLKRDKSINRDYNNTYDRFSNKKQSYYKHRTPNQGLDIGRFFNNLIKRCLPGEDCFQFEDGGPIKVTDPNDPRLKAYNDSNLLYNVSNRRELQFNKDPFDSRLNEYGKEVDGLAKRLKMNPIAYRQGWDSSNFTEFPFNSPDAEYYLQSDEPYIAIYKKPVQPYEYDRNIPLMPKRPINKKVEPVPLKTKVNQLGPPLSLNLFTDSGGSYMDQPQVAPKTDGTTYSPEELAKMGYRGATSSTRPTGETINKYAYGGEVTSDSDENHISNSREFLKGWYNSPKYKEMLAASVSNKKNPIKEARLINEGRLYGLSVPVKTIPDLRKKQGAFGLNDITTNQIFLDKGFIKENPGLASSLVSHELSHNAYIPKSDIAKIKSFTPAYDPKIHHTSIMKNDPKENYNSLTDPEEVRAMIYGLRNLSKGNNIYDPFTEPATKEHLQQLAPLFQNTESGRSYDQLNRLKTYYTEEQIIDMMNTISENKNVNQNPPMAKHGGPIKYTDVANKYFNAYQEEFNEDDLVPMFQKEYGLDKETALQYARWIHQNPLTRRDTQFLQNQPFNKSYNPPYPPSQGKYKLDTNLNSKQPVVYDEYQTGGPIKYGTIDKSIPGINRDATYVAPSSQQIDYSYNQNVPFGTSNPNVNPFYKKQAAEQFVSQGQSATIKNVDNSKQHKYQKVLNSVSTNNDLLNGVLDFAKFPFQSGINLMNPQIRNDEDVLNTAIDVAGVLPIVGTATKFGIKTVNTGVDIAHNIRTAFNTLNEFKNAEKANELLNPQYLSIKEIPDKVRRIGNIWTNPTSNASEELIKYQRLRKANITDDHLQSLTGLSKKDIDDKIIDISNSIIKTAETINVDNLPGVPTLDDLTRLMQQNRNNTNPRLQNYINQNLDRMENEIIQSRGTIDLTRRPRRNNTEGQSNIGSDYPNIDTSFENSVLNSTTGILDRTRNFEYQDYLNQLNDNIISNLLRNTPTNTNDNFLNNFLNDKFNTKGINKQINNTILRKYILKSEGDVSSAKFSLYRNNSNVDAELAQIDNYVASAQSGDKIRGASSLSDSSFPLVVTKLKQHLLNKNLKGVEFEGYNSLNTSGYLNQAGIHPDIIIPYLNSHIKKLSEATGKKIPHAYYEENKGIMFPSLVGVKKEYGGVVKMADGGIVDYSLGSYVKDSGKLLLNTVASPLEQISGNNFVNFEYDNKGMADAAAVSEGVLGAATDVAGSYFLGPAYGMAKSTIQPMTSQIGHSTEYQKGANKWANQTGQIASSVGNLTSGIMSGNAQQIVGGSGQLLGTLGKEFDSKELAISGQVVGSASQFVGQGKSSGDSSSMTGAGDMVSSAGTQSAKHGGVVKLRKSSSVNWLDKYEDGGETKAQLENQWKPGSVSQRDSVQNMAYNTMTWEENRGDGSGYGLSNFGNLRLPAGATKDDAVAWYMQNIYPELGDYPTAMEKAQAGDFLYNAGKNLFNYTDWDNRKNDTKAKQSWENKKKTLTTNDRRVTLNNARDKYYQNTAPSGSAWDLKTQGPHPAYLNTWYGRQHATDQYVPLTDADVTNTSNKKFYPVKKQTGGETKAQEGIPSVATANQQAIQNAGTPYLNRAMVQAVLANASQPVTNTLGRVISTPTSREKERREKVIANDPSQYSVMPGFQSDYKLGIQEPGADNSVLSDPIAMAAALTAGGVGLGAYGLSQVPRVFARNLASEATMGLSDLTRAGLKGAAKQLPGSNNTDELVDLWRIQERGARPMSELAAEGKLGPMFQNEKAIQHFKDREKYFGQWFTKDKADFDFYKADREFVDPEIIQLQVPKSKLAEFQNYDKSLSRAADREFIIPLEQQKLFTPTQLPGSPNVVSSVDDVVTQSWQMQEMPGLHLKSTMEGQAISKIVEPKTGLVNTEQALAIIGKESGGAEKVAMIKKAFGDNIPQKMDYNEFRKTVQEQLIPLERQFSTGRSAYGVDKLGYNLDKGSKIKLTDVSPEEYIPEIEEWLKVKPTTKGVKFKSIKDTFEGQGTLAVTGIKPNGEEFTWVVAKSDLPSFASRNPSDILENQTLILGNKDKFGVGSSAHGNPDETLGHIHFLRDTETPDVLTVTQIQSDAFQGTHRRMPKGKLTKTNDSIDNDYIDEAGKYFDTATGENITQKSLLDKNHQERYLQELVDYAGKRGDVNKIRVPTSETAANVQGYYKQPFNIGDISDESLITYNNLKKQKENAEQLLTIGKNITEKEKAELLSVINNPELKKIEMLQKYSPKDQTILNKYSEQPKLIKKLFGKEPAIVTDSKGNTWYEFDIPESFKQGKGQIKAFGLAPTVLGAGALGKFISDNKSNPEQTYGKGGSVNNNWLDKYN